MKIDSVYAPLQYLCGSLANCVYLLANNNEILGEIEYSDPDEGNFDLVIIATRNGSQCRDVLLNQRDNLVMLINQHLQGIEETSIQLKVDIECDSWIYLLGDENNSEFSVDSVDYSYISDRESDTGDSVFLFFPQIDFGDIPSMQVKNLRGDFWQLNGNIELAKALWPFVIDYERESIALSEYKNIIVCDNREK